MSGVRFLMVALAASCLAPSGAHAEEALVKCTVGTMAPFMAPRHHCDMLTIEADAMRAVATNAPAGYPHSAILSHCEKGLSANLPGFDRQTYLNACEQIIAAVR